MAGNTSIRTVPFRTPFFQQPDDFSAAGTQKWVLNRTWLLFFEQLQNTFWARVILPGTQTVANDVLANRYRVKEPRGVALQQFWMTAKVAPASQIYIADILRSSDGGTTFQSIFPTGNTNKLNLPIGKAVLNVIPAANGLAITQWSLDDLIRVDVLQADATVSGIEIGVLGVPL